MTQTETALSTFALLLANDQENVRAISSFYYNVQTSRLRQSLDKCSFCHSRTNLTPCADCGCVAYCGSEHQVRLSGFFSIFENCENKEAVSETPQNCQIY